MASSTADNVMSRFLFAILKQKNLRDIDWNLVAKDPVLAQEISNGHAARMRYSRFKSSITGSEPTKRNRTASKNRVTKSKKDPKATKDSHKSERGDSPGSHDGDDDSQNSKSGSGSQERSRRTDIGVKRELPYGLDTRMTPGMTPGSTPAPPSLVTPHNLQSQYRFLTPASETDPFTPATLAPSPTNEFFNNPPPSAYDLHMTSALPQENPMCWQQGMQFPTVPTMFPFENMMAGQCEQHMYAHQEPFNFLNRSIEHDDDDLEHDHSLEHDHDHVKDEDWDCVA